METILEGSASSPSARDPRGIRIGPTSWDPNTGRKRGLYIYLLNTQLLLSPGVKFPRPPAHPGSRHQLRAMPSPHTKGLSINLTLPSRVNQSCVTQNTKSLRLPPRAPNPAQGSLPGPGEKGRGLETKRTDVHSLCSE